MDFFGEMMNNLPEVQLESWVPNGIIRVLKLSLTESSEINIFGDVSSYRTAPLPPFPWGNEQYFHKKLAVIDDTQVEIYNAFVKQVYSQSPELIIQKMIIAGVVEVFRASHNVQLKNVL